MRSRDRATVEHSFDRPPSDLAYEDGCSATEQTQDACRHAMAVFLTHWGPLQVDDDVLRKFAGIRLDDDLLYTLHCIGAVETNSIHQLGNALAARIGEDPVLSEFLPRWAAEEAEHGQILRRLVLEARGIETSRGVPAEPAVVKTWRQARTFRQRNSRFLVEVAVRTIPHLTSLYATFGAIQEHSVMQGYRLLARRANLPLLSSVLDKVLAQEARHFAVYFTQARRFLEGNKRAQMVTRIGLSRYWSPVGFHTLGPAGWDRVRSFLCPTELDELFLARTDQVIGRLPGLEGLSLMGPAIKASRDRCGAAT